MITGMGAVTPLGNGVQETWHRACVGESGIARLSRLSAATYDIHAAGELKDFDAGAIADRKERRYIDEFCLYALAAALEATNDAELTIEPSCSSRTGIVIGTGFGGLGSFERNHGILLRRGARHVGPHAIPAGMANAAAAHIAQRLQVTGPNHTVMTACAAGAHALGTALRLLQFGDADVILAGGAEAPICASAIAGFYAMGALSRCNDPLRASRPFDAIRDGFVLGEGAGIMVLETLDHALARGARIRAELLGYGASADAYHVCAPPSEGIGAVQAMRAALADAGVEATDVEYINAHGTGTRYNDAVETRAIKSVFGPYAPQIPVTASKSMLGHLIGAGAAVESILTIKTIEEGIIPPTLNLEFPDPDCDLDYPRGESRRTPVRVAIKNSFGFGGNNAALVFRAVQ